MTNDFETLSFNCTQFLRGKLMPGMDSDDFLSSLMGLYKVDAPTVREAMRVAMEREFNRDIGQQLIRRIVS